MHRENADDRHPQDTKLEDAKIENWLVLEKVAEISHSLSSFQKCHLKAKNKGK